MDGSIEERNFSLCTETSSVRPGLSDPRTCQTVVKKKKPTRKFLPILLDLEAEWKILKEEEEKRKQLLAQRKCSAEAPIVPEAPCTEEQSISTPAKPLVEPRSIFATPNNPTLVTPRLSTINENPKIQCSVNMSSYLKKKTPITNSLHLKQRLRTSVETPVNHKPPSSDSKMRSYGDEGPNKENTPSPNNVPVASEGLGVMVVNNVRYIVLNQLGRGGSSVVHNCYEPKGMLECAIKCVDFVNQDKNAVAGYINEVKMLHNLQHCSRVIKMHAYEIQKDEKKLYVVLEKGSKDLSRILKELTTNASKHLPMYKFIYYWMEMLYAVKEIHDNGVIHSDLKPANFLEAGGKLKIIDFGISSSVQNDMTSVVKNIPIGTFSYISPEALQNDQSTNCDSPNYGKPKFKIGYKSDVWSLGCMFYQMVYGRTPFQHITHQWAKISAIIDPHHEIKYGYVDWLPQNIIDTVRCCLRYNMKERPSVDDLIAQYERLYS